MALAEARRILRDEAHAQDAAQEALIRAWRHASRCADPDCPGPWLRVIARREALRITGRLEPVGLPPGAEPGGERPASLEAIDVRAAVSSRLDELDRSLILQRYWLGMTDHQIAGSRGLPVGTVKTRLHRARGKLRAALDVS